MIKINKTIRGAFVLPIFIVVHFNDTQLLAENHVKRPQVTHVIFMHKLFNSFLETGNLCSHVNLRRKLLANKIGEQITVYICFLATFPYGRHP